MSGEDRSGWKEMSTIGRKKGLECGTTEISRLFSSSIFTAYPFKGIWCIPYERMGRLSTCKQKFLHWQYYSTPAYLKTNTSIPQMPENHYQLIDYFNYNRSMLEATFNETEITFILHKLSKYFYVEDIHEVCLLLIGRLKEQEALRNGSLTESPK